MKSFVTLEFNQCPVCYELHQTGALLLDKKMRDRLERETCTGFSLCPEHQKMYENNYVALVEIEEPEDKVGLNPSTVKPTGRVAFLHSDAFRYFFDGDTPDGLAYIGSEVFNRIEVIHGTHSKN